MSEPEDWRHDYGIPLDPEGLWGTGMSGSDLDALARLRPDLFPELDGVQPEATVPGWTESDLAALARRYPELVDHPGVSS